MISELWVSGSFFIAGVCCIVYAVTRRRRKARSLFGWLAVPCFTYAVLYIWFQVGAIPLEARAQPARLLNIMIAFFISLITSLSVYFNTPNHHEPGT